MKIQTFGKGFLAWFIFCAAMGIGMAGVAIWAIIKLVTHFTK